MTIAAFTDPGAALGQMLGALTAYERASAKFVAAKAAWTSQECKGSRIRNEAVAANKAAGMKVTEAEARASEFPAYAAHRDELARLQNELTAAETDMHVAIRRFEAAKEIHTAAQAVTNTRNAQDIAQSFRGFKDTLDRIEAAQ